jgi:integrase
MAKVLSGWVILQGRMALNPLATVAKVDQTVKTRVRRALTNDELASLFKQSPHYRRVPYLMSARTGLRYGELSELVWGDIVLDGEKSHVLVRASISKNKKEARIPLIAELEQLLSDFKPEGVKPMDRVFKDGVPRCVTLKKDLMAADIPYVDESGRYADFHALRYTFNTWLQTNGVPPRMAQELMRHSDRRLTDQVYLDTSLLPLQECMRSIDGFGEWTQIWTQIPGKTCRLGSRVGETGEEGEIAGTPLTVGSRRSLTQPDGRLRMAG